MVEVYLEKNSKGELTGFIVEGHAGFEEAGQDIVCAAVSVLVQTTVLGLERILQVEFKEFHLHSGKLICRIQDISYKEAQEKVRVLLQTMELGLQETASHYPDYVTVSYLKE